MNIIAISGSGRSGSTLLSLLLSQDARVFNLGQLRHLWRSYEQTEACSCGHTLPDCLIYGESAANRGAMTELGKAFFKDAASQANWRGSKTRSGLQDRHPEYLEGIQQLLIQITAKTGATHFVDSSKAPEFALAFSLLPDVDLYLLNLVRDPRAVVCSWYKRKQSYSAAIRNARDWSARQQRLEDWKPALGTNFYTLRYEDLAAKPVDVIESIADWCSLPLPDALFEAADLAHIEWSNQHLYPPANERVLADDHPGSRSDGAAPLSGSGSGPLPENLFLLAYTIHLRTIPGRGLARGRLEERNGKRK